LKDCIGKQFGLAGLAKELARGEIGFRQFRFANPRMHYDWDVPVDQETNDVVTPTV